MYSQAKKTRSMFKEQMSLIYHNDAKCQSNKDKYYGPTDIFQNLVLLSTRYYCVDICRHHALVLTRVPLSTKIASSVDNFPSTPFYKYFMHRFSF